MPQTPIDSPLMSVVALSIMAIACVIFPFAAIGQPVPDELKYAPPEVKDAPIMSYSGRKYAPPMDRNDHPQNTTRNGGATR